MTTVQMPLTASQRDTAQSELLDHLRQATLGEYDIAGELGRGGMATVYLAHDIALDRQVAIKVMNPGLMMGEGTRDRFKREARTAAALTHPHIIPVHLVRETDRVVFFIMKYVQGRGLDSIIFERGPLPIRMAQTILTQVGGALGYAHRRGVVHRDIKPANIMIDDEGWAVVTDFGIAKVSDASLLTKSGVTVGTPYYMSPEQCSARPVTGASDQYSLGVVGYEMLAGKTPFAGDSLMDIMRKHFFELPAPLLTIRLDCPESLATAIERMLAKEPEGRWPSIDDAIGAMAAQPLSHDDPIRSQMIELARSGIKPVTRLPVPVSPTPIDRPSSVKPRAAAHTAPSKPDVARSKGVLKRVLWGAVAVLTVGLVFGLTRWVRPTTGITPPPSVARIEITGAPATIEVGQQVRLAATAKTEQGAVVDTATVRWSSRDTAVARVSADGLVTAMAAGSTAITATSGSGSQSVPVTINAPGVASVEVVPAGARVPVRGTLRLTAFATDARGGHLVGRRITWSSQDPAIATVSETGVVTGMAPGAVTLDATSEGHTASVRISVLPLTLATLTVLPMTVRLEVGDSTKLTVQARDASGRLLEGRDVEWGSSDRAVASVSPTGVVTGISPGTASVTAMAEGVKSARVAATVLASAPMAPAVFRLLITPWAKVSIDGRDRGQRDRLEERVPARAQHRVHLERPGFATVDTTVTLEPGEMRLLRIQLLPRNP